MPNAVKLKEPPQYDGAIDYELIKAWIFGVDNYYKLVGLTNEVQHAWFAATLLIKNAALWLRSFGLDLDRTKWSTPKTQVRDCFCPADYRCRACNKLATMKQRGKVTYYIDSFKCCCSKIANITDDEMLDRFVRGLSTNI